MVAEARTGFTQKFLLDEEKLRKIHSIFIDRIQKMKMDIRPTYTVSRVDGYSFTTEDVEEIVSEENASWEKIRDLDVKLSRNPILTASLKLQEKWPSLKVYGEDRDNVSLLHTDLRLYLQREVFVIKNFALSATIKTFLFAIVVLALITIFAQLLNRSPDPISKIDVLAAVSSNEISEKLDMLLAIEASNIDSDPNDTPLNYLAGLLLLTMVITFSDELFNAIGNWVNPGNLFLFGKEKQRYEKFLSTRSKFVWGVLIGLIVTIIGSLFVNQII